MAWMRQGIKGKSKNANAAITVDARNDLHAGAKTDASVSNTQTACHNKGKRIAADGVTVGTKSAKIYAELEAALVVAETHLAMAQAVLDANYSRVAHRNRADLRRVYLQACEARNNFME